MVIYNVQSNGSCNQLVIELINDSIYIEPNAVAYVSGDINMESKGNIKKDLKASLIGKRFFKPRFQGTGKIYIKPTLGTFHKFALKDDQELVITPNSFIACRDSVQIAPQTNLSLGNFLMGVPMINMTVKGTGNVMVLMPGPVQELPVKEEKFIAFNYEIAAYSPTLKISREIVGKDWVRGQKMVKVFRGSGSIFFCPIPNKDAKP